MQARSAAADRFQTMSEEREILTWEMFGEASRALAQMVAAWEAAIDMMSKRMNGADVAVAPGKMSPKDRQLLLDYLATNMGPNAKKRALARCKATVEWEYELLDRPSVLDEVDQLVDKVYGR